MILTQKCTYSRNGESARNLGPILDTNLCNRANGIEDKLSNLGEIVCGIVEYIADKEKIQFNELNTFLEKIHSSLRVSRCDATFIRCEHADGSIEEIV